MPFSITSITVAILLWYGIGNYLNLITIRLSQEMGYCATDACVLNLIFVEIIYNL